MKKFILYVILITLWSSCQKQESTEIKDNSYVTTIDEDFTLIKGKQYLLNVNH